MVFQIYSIILQNIKQPTFITVLKQGLKHLQGFENLAGVLWYVLENFKSKILSVVLR